MLIWMSCAAAIGIACPEAKAEYLLNCRLMNPGHPLFRQHCKAEVPLITTEITRYFCFTKQQCMKVKKKNFSKYKYVAVPTASTAPSRDGSASSDSSSVTASTGGSNTTSGVGGAVSTTSDGAGGAVSDTGNSVGGTVSGAGDSLGASNVGSAAGGTVSNVGNTVGGTVSNVGSTAGSLLR
jgi:hypothetical protein